MFAEECLICQLSGMGGARGVRRFVKVVGAGLRPAAITNSSSSSLQPTALTLTMSRSSSNSNKTLFYEETSSSLPSSVLEKTITDAGNNTMFWLRNMSGASCAEGGIRGI